MGQKQKQINAGRQTKESRNRTQKMNAARLRKNKSSVHEPADQGIPEDALAQSESDIPAFSRVEVDDLPPLVVDYLPPDPKCDPKIDDLQGRRVVDIKHFITEIRILDRHRCPVNSRGSLLFQSERRFGLVSHLLFECPFCEAKTTLTTDPIFPEKVLRRPSATAVPKSSLGINDGAVWGSISTGGGHSSMEEFFSMIDVPSMTSKTFRKHEAYLGKKWEKVLLAEMDRAAQEEKALAVQQGRVGKSGKPWTTAIVDGGWSQRSYGHRYSAKSGCAVIVGLHTKKLLFLGIRNKFCSVCARAATREEESGPHTCFKNWSKASTAMEADIIVEGFNFCEQVYGIRFHKFVGDGDSSVLSCIRQNVPYGVEVQKFECANHVTKNLTKALHDVAKATSCCKILNTNRIKAISNTARRIISRNRNNPGLIKTDLLNLIDHSFNDHTRCRSEVCGQAGSIVEPNIKNSLSRESLVGIRSAVGRMAGKSHALSTNATSNRAEMYMHLVTKFTGGKQINRSQRGSYNRRCHAAGLSYQLGAGWHGSTWKAITGKSPCVSVKRLGSRILKRQAACRKSLFQSGNKRRYLKNRIQEPSKPEGDEHYGPNATQPDLPQEEMKIRCEGFLLNLAVTEEQRNQLEVQTRDQSGNDQWWKERRCRLTASNFGAICKMRDSTSCIPTVKRLLYDNMVSSDATRYGIQMEEVAVDAYERLNNVVVQKCGLFVDLEHGFLAASPDGLVGDDGILEIKCPHSVQDLKPLEAASTRKDFFCTVDSKGQLQLKRSHNYYFQVQGEIRATGREWCDFVVWTPRGLDVERIVRDCRFWENRMFPKLNSFFLCCLLPELVDPRLTRRLEIREPEHILLAMEAVRGKKRKRKDTE